MTKVYNEPVHRLAMYKAAFLPTSYFIGEVVKLLDIRQPVINLLPVLI